MNSRWRSVRFFCVYLFSFTHLENVYWGLGDPHLVRGDHFESATASSLGARPARQTLASGRELGEGAEQQLLQTQGWGCADVASRHRSVWSRVSGLPSQGEEGSAEVGRGGCTGKGTGLDRRLVQVLRGKFMFIHPPVCQHLCRCWDNIASRHWDKALWGLHFNRGESGNKELNR